MRKFYTWYLVLLVFTGQVMTGIAHGQNMSAGSPFAVRGFHLDLRIQVMKMPALKSFVKQLAGQGINTLVMEWEASYPYSDPLLRNRYAYSKEEIVSFINYCKELHIDVVPLQQSFGHVEYILRHYKYAALREDNRDFSQVCPSELALNKALFTQLYKDLIATHNSPYIHIGGDETYLLGHCAKCQKRVAEAGISKLYFDHVRMLCEIAVELGKRPVVWADMALKYPEYIKTLPRETVLVDWNYGWPLNRFGAHEKLMQSGYEIWGAPALRSDPDNYFLTRWQYHFANIRDFCQASREMGYKGIILTSWSTSGVYNALYESSDALIDLYAIRHVYPVNGFMMLVAAYKQTIHQSGKLNIDSFVTAFAQNNYGFNQKNAELFRRALFTAPYTVSDGKVHAPFEMSLQQLRDSVDWAAKTLRALNPLKNAGSFAHYQLMADIRVYYMDFLQIEALVNADSFSESSRASVIQRLGLLLRQGELIDQRFLALQVGLLYPAALKEENNLRNQRVRLLYERLAQKR